MEPNTGVEGVRVLLREFETHGFLLSTGASVVDFVEDLFNVTGSTPDPSQIPGHENKSWKEILEDEADLHNASCYVTNAIAPDNSSHPAFSVGGHVTPNSDGVVPFGGVCYLMPLCSWHNHTARDGVQFEHSNTKMLQLTGFLQGELASTFELRRPSEKPFALLEFDSDSKEWKHQNLTINELRANDAKSRDKKEEVRLLLERSEGEQPQLTVKDVTLPAE